MQNLDQIISELKVTKVSERSGRVMIMSKKMSLRDMTKGYM